MTVFILVTIVFYFSWLPSPEIGFLGIFPAWLGRWTNANANANLRTAVPFLFFGTIAEIWYFNTSSPFKRRVIMLLVSSLIVIVAEVGQLFLPKRTFDLRDIAWGITGTATGIITGFGLCYLYRRCKES
jgi:hypothetical protein